MPSTKVRKNAKIRNRYNQVPHLIQDIEWESDKKQENITHRRGKRSSLSHQVTTKLQDTGSTILPIGQRPFALLDSSKSIYIKSISTAATIYLMSTALQNCKINCLYSVLPGKLEVIMLIALINWYKSCVLFHCHNTDHSSNNNR